MSKHTPGPWKICLASDLYIEPDRGSDIYQRPLCRVLPNFPVGTNAANARLIAAAPDLLRMCKVVRDYWEALEDQTDHLHNHPLADIKAAITKAEKGEP